MDNFADYIANNIALKVDPNVRANDYYSSFVCMPYNESCHDRIVKQLDQDLPLIRRRLGLKSVVSNIDVEFVYENDNNLMFMYYDIEYKHE